jgi:nucleoid-associated protein YgaU
MAIRVEELEAPFEAPRDARIYRFPVEATRPSRAELRRRAIRRRRAVARRRALVAVLIVVISVTMLFAGGPSSVSTAGDRGTPRAIVVQPGQTLWALAERYAGDGVDPRAYVDAILALNGLDSPPQAGARIRLPR